MVTPAVLVVPDGAADPLGASPTCLEQARTPALDRLATAGRLLRVRTIPAELPAGTEVGLPALLGLRVAGPLPRGPVEAAAAGVAVGPGETAWRLDAVGQAELDAATVARVHRAVAPLGARVLHLSAHRMLLVGPASWGDGPPGPHQTDRPLRALARGPLAAVAVAASAVLRPAEAWPWGRAGDAALPPAPRACTVVTPGGPAAGIAALLGCAVVRADGEAAVAAALHAADADGLAVLHVPDADDAGHARDRAGKIAAIERLDATVAALASALAARGGALAISPDHGCDPETGRHTEAAVPGLVWRAGDRGRVRRRLTERSVADVAETCASELLAALTVCTEAVA